MVERLVPGGVRVAQPHSGHHSPALDADPLRGDAYPRVAVAHEVPVGRHPQCRDVDSTGDVEPLDDQRAVAARGIGRPVHDEPRREVGTA